MPMFKGRDEAWLVKDFEAKGWPSAAAREIAEFLVGKRTEPPEYRREMMDPNGWMTIDSAPKDGAHILCWREGWEQPELLLWKENHRIGDDDPELLRWYFGDPYEMDDYEYARRDGRDAPTHWLDYRPFPDPDYWKRRQALKDKRSDIE